MYPPPHLCIPRIILPRNPSVARLARRIALDEAVVERRERGPTGSLQHMDERVATEFRQEGGLSGNLVYSARV